MSPTPGRPATGAAVRRPRITDAVLTAALDVLEEAGYERLSMDEVARRAGVGKAALYRRWSGKLDMVLDALTRLSAPTEQIEAASLADAVEKLLRQAVAWLTDAKIRAVLPDLIAQAGRHPELASALRDHVGGPRRQWADKVLGAWTPDSPAGSRSREMAIDLLAAPLFWRLAQQLAIDDDYLRRLGDLITDALADTPAKSPPIGPRADLE
jgi:AcrR family transcriptional regulator